MVEGEEGVLGAIVGDIVGSIYEHRNIKSKAFPLFGDGCRFTDDTVCTVAVADCLMSGGDFAVYLRRYARRYPAPRVWRHVPRMGLHRRRSL